MRFELDQRRTDTGRIRVYVNEWFKSIGQRSLRLRIGPSKFISVISAIWWNIAVYRDSENLRLVCLPWTFDRNLMIQARNILEIRYLNCLWWLKMDKHRAEIDNICPGFIERRW
jgi:hypothetical protein